jgi:hypothetical protein
MLRKKVKLCDASSYKRVKFFRILRNHNILFYQDNTEDPRSIVGPNKGTLQLVCSGSPPIKLPNLHILFPSCTDKKDTQNRHLQILEKERQRRRRL